MYNAAARSKAENEIAPRKDSGEMLFDADTLDPTKYGHVDRVYQSDAEYDEEIKRIDAALKKEGWFSAGASGLKKRKAQLEKDKKELDAQREANIQKRGQLVRLRDDLTEEIPVSDPKKLHEKYKKQLEDYGIDTGDEKRDLEILRDRAKFELGNFAAEDEGKIDTSLGGIMVGTQEGMEKYNALREKVKRGETLNALEARDMRRFEVRMIEYIKTHPKEAAAKGLSVASLPKSSKPSVPGSVPKTPASVSLKGSPILAMVGGSTPKEEETPTTGIEEEAKKEEIPDTGITAPEESVSDGYAIFDKDKIDKKTTELMGYDDDRIDRILEANAEHGFKMQSDGPAGEAWIARMEVIRDAIEAGELEKPADIDEETLNKTAKMLPGEKWTVKDDEGNIRAATIADVIKARQDALFSYRRDLVSKNPVRKKMAQHHLERIGAATKILELNGVDTMTVNADLAEGDFSRKRGLLPKKEVTEKAPDTGITPPKEPVKETTEEAVTEATPDTGIETPEGEEEDLEAILDGITESDEKPVALTPELKEYTPKYSSSDRFSTRTSAERNILSPEEALERDLEEEAAAKALKEETLPSGIIDEELDTGIALPEEDASTSDLTEEAPDLSSKIAEDISATEKASDEVSDALLEVVKGIADDIREIKTTIQSVV